MISEDGLLFIEPAHAASATPLIDQTTRKMCAALRNARRPTPFQMYGGVHECFCGAHSTACNYVLPNGDLTNSLCVHYVAYHRSEVPPRQLAKIEAFTFGETDPSEQELQGPQLILARVRSRVEWRLGTGRLEFWTALGLDAEALARELQGGCLQLQGLTPARDNAERLLILLDVINTDSLPFFTQAAEKEYGDMRKWAENALRIPDWRPEAWVSPLLAILRQSDSFDRRMVLSKLWALGPAAEAAVPMLIELAKWGVGDRGFQSELRLALDHLGRVLGVSLLDRIPPSTRFGDRFLHWLRTKRTTRD